MSRLEMTQIGVVVHNNEFPVASFVEDVCINYMLTTGKNTIWQDDGKNVYIYAVKEVG